MKKIVGIGEVLWDVFPGGKQPGGAPGNFAYHAMKAGFEGYAISAIGNDPLGDEIQAFMDSKQLCTMLERVDFPTGTVEVTLDAAGVPTYVIHEQVAWDYIPFTQSMQALAKETDAVCFGTLALRNAVSRKTITGFVNLVPAHALKIFDINLRQHFYNKELIEDCLNTCNVLKINDEEVEVLIDLFDSKTKDETLFCTNLMKQYDLRLLILTKGTNGSTVFSANGDISEKPTPQVQVIDTVGAGDSFTAAFVAGILKGKSISEAHEDAVQLSAFVCSSEGAMPDY